MLEELQNRIAVARVGTTLRRKWILEELAGIGGMAAVYRARHRNGARVAVKVLHPVLGESDDIRRRFTHEGYVANKIDHPAVVRVLDDDTDEHGLPFFVMDLVEGETLADRVKDRYFDDDELLDVAEQVCDALAAAHAAGVVHRDLKPDNLLIDDAGKVRVLDFGIARVLEEGMEQSTFSTRTGIAFGTPGFTAPEQALGKRRDIGPHTDLFALGATLFYLASGEFIHHAETPQELLVLVATKPARSLAEAAPRISREIVAIIDRATRTAIADRWPSAEAMLDEVRRVRRKRAGIPEIRDAETLVPPAPRATSEPPPRTRKPPAEVVRTAFAVRELTATRPSVARRRERRRRSLVAIATGSLLAGALLVVPGAPGASRPIAPVAAEVTTDTIVTDDAPVSVEAPPAPVAAAPPPKASWKPPSNEAAKLLERLVDRRKKGH